MNTFVGNVASSLNQSFVRSSYGFFLNGTNDTYGLGSDKFSASDFFYGYGVDYLTFNFTQLYINDILVFDGYNEYYYAESPGDFYFRDDGYGVGPASYADVVNGILQDYKLVSRIYQTGSGNMTGVFNSKENFEIRFQEYAAGVDIATDYYLKSQFGSVSDYVNESWISWS